MTVKVGDDVLILASGSTAPSGATPSNHFTEGKIHRVSSGNLSVLQSMVNGGTARVLNAGLMRYIATITQSSTSAPVATVLESGLSAAVVWTRISAGLYVGTLANAFTVGKTIQFQTDIQAVADTTIALNTITLSTNGDGKLTGQTLYIEVLP